MSLQFCGSALHLPLALKKWKWNLKWEAKTAFHPWDAGLKKMITSLIAEDSKTFLCLKSLFFPSTIAMAFGHMDALSSLKPDKEGSLPFHQGGKCCACDGSDLLNHSMRGACVKPRGAELKSTALNGSTDLGCPNSRV